MIVLIDSKSEKKFKAYGDYDIFASRIVSDYELYGCDLKFALFYLQLDDGQVVGLLSKVDDVVTFSVSDERFVEETAAFIQVIGCQTVLCDKKFAKYLSSAYTDGAIMASSGTNVPVSSLPGYADSEVLKEVYALICSAHPIAPDFASWFTDTSRKLRHHKASLVLIRCDGQIVSCAFARILSPSKIMISGVSTLASYRKKGYARDCVAKILSDHSDKKCYVFTENEAVASWYEKMGFIKKGFWCEING